MIARSILLFIAIIVLPDIFIWRKWLHGKGKPKWMKAVWVGQALALLAVTAWLAMSRDFTPQPQTPLNAYLLAVGVWVVPKCFFAIALWMRQLTAKSSNALKIAATAPWIMLAILTVYVTVYGSTVGFDKVEVRKVVYYSEDLPEAFDGYRIALLSDIHVGSYTGMHQHVLGDAVDSIIGLRPDAIFFLGDIQNTRPEEVVEKMPVLKRLNAPDGVLSILGNHDYSYYMGGSEAEKKRAELLTIDCQRKMGWRMLLNENVKIRRQNDSIVVAGLEGNDKINTDHGYPRCDLAMEGIGNGCFTIMLVHNPARWQEMVLPKTTAQLSLSGHTHGGQIDFFGLVEALPVEVNGMYEKDGRSLFVTAGLGALIPLRFGVTGEVVELILRKGKKNNH